MRLRLSDKFKEFSPTTIRQMAYLAMTCLAGGLFLKLTWELKEDSDLRHLDEAILQLFGRLRLSAFNGPAVDLTALGSPTLVSLFCIVGIVVLLLARCHKDAIFFFISIAGGGIWSTVLKTLLRRERPNIIPRLVEVSNYSYPSGHSLSSTAVFLALALIATRHFGEWRERAIIFAIAGLLISFVALSRVYLGVHYPSDVLSGVLFGAGWTFGLAAFFFRKESEREQLV